MGLDSVTLVVLICRSERLYGRASSLLRLNCFTEQLVNVGYRYSVIMWSEADQQSNDVTGYDVTYMHTMI